MKKGSEKMENSSVWLRLVSSLETGEIGKRYPGD